MSALPVQCAPNVAPQTISAIVQVESHGNPLAIHDNTASRSYTPATLEQAQALLSVLLRAGHSVDAGLMQVNSGHFREFNLTSASVFNPCVNINVGGQILDRAWKTAKRAGLAGQNALWHAVQAYNSGNLRGATDYARQVWAAAGHSAAGRLMVETSRVRPSAVAYVGQWSQPWVASTVWPLK